MTATDAGKRMNLGMVPADFPTTLVGRLGDVLAAERAAIQHHVEAYHDKVIQLVESELEKRSARLSGSECKPPIVEAAVEGKSGEVGCINESFVEWNEENGAHDPVNCVSHQVTQQELDSVLSLRHKFSCDLFVAVRKRHGMLRALVDSPWFEAFFVCIILINTVFSALDAQYRGFDAGHAVSFPNFSNTAEKTWPGADDVFKTMEIVFASVYTLELALKLAAYGIRFWRDPWCIFDFVIVALWYLVEVIDLRMGNPTILRLCRLARLMRWVRHVGWFENFDSLHMLLTAIRSSLSILFWSAMLIFTLLVISALIMNGLLGGYLDDMVTSAEAGVVFSEDALEERQLVFEYFGTFTRALISMFEITFGNHAKASRIVISYVGEGYALFLLLFKCVVSLSIMKVISGVFINETFSVCQEDNNLMVIKKKRAMRDHLCKMRLLFEKVDRDEDGYLSWVEFQEVLVSDWIRTWMSAMGLDASNLRRLWRLIDDGDGRVTAEELITGVWKLQGLAKSVDLNHLSMEIDLLKDEILQMHSKVGLTQQHVSTHTELITRMHSKTCSENGAFARLAHQPEAIPPQRETPRFCRRSAQGRGEI